MMVKRESLVNLGERDYQEKMYMEKSLQLCLFLSIIINCRVALVMMAILDSLVSQDQGDCPAKM